MFSVKYSHQPVSHNTTKEAPGTGLSTAKLYNNSAATAFSAVSLHQHRNMQRSSSITPQLLALHSLGDIISFCPNVELSATSFVLQSAPGLLTLSLQ